MSVVFHFSFFLPCWILIIYCCNEGLIKGFAALHVGCCKILWGFREREFAGFLNKSWRPFCMRKGGENCPWHKFVVGFEVLW